MSLSYALYHNKVSKEKNVYRALIKNRDKITLEEIIDRMASRHAGISKSEAMATLELFMNEIEYILEDGGVISTPLFYAQCSISGKFNSSEDHFYPNRHEIKINLRPGNRLKSLAGKIKAYRVNSNMPGPAVNEFIDMSSGLRNSQIKPGASAIIHGKKLAFDANDPKQGVYFNGAGNTSYKVEKVLLNTFSQLYIVIPENLPEGNYRLEIRSSLKTKTIRGGELANSLTVG